MTTADALLAYFRPCLMQCTSGYMRTVSWSLMMCQVSGTRRLDSSAKAWFPVRGAPKV